MNKEDHPLVIYRKQRFRLVPELPGEDTSTWARCTMCVACSDGDRDEDVCNDIRTATQGSCSGDERGPLLFLPERRFREYVVELVRRRVSS